MKQDSSFIFCVFLEQMRNCLCHQCTDVPGLWLHPLILQEWPKTKKRESPEALRGTEMETGERAGEGNEELTKQIQFWMPFSEDVLEEQVWNTPQTVILQNRWWNVVLNTFEFLYFSNTRFTDLVL